MSLRSLLSRIVAGLRGRRGGHGDNAKPAELDYERFVHLDAETLAEQGIGEAYRRLLPELGQHLAHPLDVEERIDADRPSYAVRAGASFEYVVYSPDIAGSEADSWWRATWAFFQCVNVQLAQAQAPVRLYAINGGNDLGGMFLTPAEAEAAGKALPREWDRPYLPEEKSR